MIPTPPLHVGRYVIFEAIASGGQASVHLGRLIGAEGFARTVAVKRIRPAVRETGEALAMAMLVDEARLASRVLHPNVVQTLDMLAHEGELLLVMEYVHGETVARLLKLMAQRGQQTPIDIATAIVIGTLRGLGAAHETTDEVGERLEIVHRDVSPQNVIIDTHGTARVLDFGVAKARGRTQEETEVGRIKGKLAYMAPEQLRGEVTPQVDLWSAGVMLWELLVGRKLYAGDTDEQVITRILTTRPAAPSTQRVEVDPLLDAVVLKALAADPADRFQSAQEMVTALEQGSVAPPQAVAAWLKQLAGDQLESTARRLLELDTQSVEITVVAPSAARPQTRRRRLVAGLIGLLSVGAVAAITAALTGEAEVPAPPVVVVAPAPAPLPLPVEPTPVERVAEAPPLEKPVLGKAEPLPVKSPGKRRPVSRKKGCEQPTTVDANGHVHYKRECL